MPARAPGGMMSWLSWSSANRTSLSSRPVSQKALVEATTSPRALRSAESLQSETASRLAASTTRSRSSPANSSGAVRMRAFAGTVVAAAASRLPIATMETESDERSDSNSATRWLMAPQPSNAIRRGFLRTALQSRAGLSDARNFSPHVSNASRVARFSASVNSSSGARTFPPTWPSSSCQYF